MANGRFTLGYATFCPIKTTSCLFNTSCLWCSVARSNCTCAKAGVNAVKHVGFWLDGHLVGAKWEQCPQDPKNNKTCLQMTVHIEACLQNWGTDTDFGFLMVVHWLPHWHYHVMLVQDSFSDTSVFLMWMEEYGQSMSKSFPPRMLDDINRMAQRIYIYSWASNCYSAIRGSGTHDKSLLSNSDVSRIIVWTNICNVKCATQRAFA